MTDKSLPPASFGNDLLRKIWITKGSRLNAYRRLSANHRGSIHAISFLSAYLLIASLPDALSFLGLQSSLSPYSSLIFPSLSMLILVLSILEAGQDYQIKAEHLHTCSLQLHELHDRICLALRENNSKKLRVTTLETANHDYNLILKSFSENHEPTDFEYFQSQHSHDFNIRWPKTMIFRMRWLLRTHGFHKLLIWGPPLLFFLWILQLI